MNKVKNFRLLLILMMTVLWSTVVKSNETDPAKQQRLLETVGKMLEQYHYSGKVIDDAFSKVIWEQYLDRLDQNKDILLEKDIQLLKKYETSIDDEIHGAKLAFYPFAVALMSQRLDELSVVYKNILSKPFTFTADEYIDRDKEKYQFSTTAAQRAERWRLQLKFMTLDNLVAAQNLRAKAERTSEAYGKTDVQLEKEAREKVLKLMNRRFLRLKANLNPDKQFDVFVNTITECMDPHSSYLPPAEKKLFDQDMSKRFYGIGAGLTEDDGVIKILSIEPGSPVWKSNEIGLNDKIVKIGQGATGEMEDISGLSIPDAIKLIRGDKGTTVRLGLIKADGTEKIVSLIREEIVQDEALARSVIIENGGRKVGYISLPQFYADFTNRAGHHSAADVAKEVFRLKEAKVSSIVIDLRNNGGGSLQEVIRMVGLFIEEGPVVQVKNRHGQVTVLKDENKNILYTGPLAVLVNEFSASASEIFAAAMQDYKRAVIIGSTSTFGKGTVQSPAPVYDQIAGTQATAEGAVKLTISKFYRINGGSTQLKGVVPDVILADPNELLKVREQDRPLALEWDQIPASSYVPSRHAAEVSAFIDRAAKPVPGDSVFTIIKTNIQGFMELQNGKSSLNMDKFKARQAEIKNKSSKLEKSLQLAEGKQLTIQTEAAGGVVDDLGSSKAARYQEWTKRLSKDIYIHKAVMIMNGVHAN